MSETAETAGTAGTTAEEAATEESPAALRYERRQAAHQAAGRVLSRTSAPATLEGDPRTRPVHPARVPDARR